MPQTAGGFATNTTSIYSIAISIQLTFYTRQLLTDPDALLARLPPPSHNATNAQLLPVRIVNYLNIYAEALTGCDLGSDCLQVVVLLSSL